MKRSRTVDGVRRVSGRVTDHPLIERARTSPVPVVALIGFSIEPLGDGQPVGRLEAPRVRHYGSRRQTNRQSRIDVHHLTRRPTQALSLIG